MQMKRKNDRLFGNQYHWPVLGTWRNRKRVVAVGASMGSHVRVGLQESLWSTVNKGSPAHG